MNNSPIFLIRSAWAERQRCHAPCNGRQMCWKELRFEASADRQKAEGVQLPVTVTATAVESPRPASIHKTADQIHVCCSLCSAVCKMKDDWPHCGFFLRYLRTSPVQCCACVCVCVDSGSATWVILFSHIPVPVKVNTVNDRLCCTMQAGMKLHSGSGFNWMVNLDTRGTWQVYACPNFQSVSIWSIV